MPHERTLRLVSHARPWSVSTGRALETRKRDRSVHGASGPGPTVHMLRCIRLTLCTGAGCTVDNSIPVKSPQNSGEYQTVQDSRMWEHVAITSRTFEVRG